MDAVGRIAREYRSARIPRCMEHDCGPSLRSLKRFVILKGELLAEGRRMSDCIIFGAGGGHVIGIIELKSRHVRASAIRCKLLNSLREASSIRDRHMDPRTPIYLIVMTKGIHPIDYQHLLAPIKFGGSTYGVFPRGCRYQFPGALGRKGRRR